MTTPDQVPATTTEPYAVEHQRLLHDLHQALGPRIDEGLARILAAPAAQAIGDQRQTTRPTINDEPPTRPPQAAGHAALVADLRAALPTAAGLAAILDTESGHADLASRLRAGMNTARGLSDILQPDTIPADQPGPGIALVPVPPEVEEPDRTAAAELARLEAAPAPQRLLMRVAGPHRPLADAMRELRNIIGHLTMAPAEQPAHGSAAADEVVADLDRQRLTINDAVRALAHALTNRPSTDPAGARPLGGVFASLDGIVHVGPTRPIWVDRPENSRVVAPDLPDGRALSRYGLAEALRVMFYQGRWDVRRFAAESGIPKSTVHRMLSGKAVPHERTLTSFVRTCGGDPEPWLQSRRDFLAAERLRRDLERATAARQEAQQDLEPPPPPLPDLLPEDLEVLMGDDRERRGEPESRRADESQAERPSDVDRPSLDLDRRRDEDYRAAKYSIRDFSELDSDGKRHGPLPPRPEDPSHPAGPAPIDDRLLLTAARLLQRSAAELARLNDLLRTEHATVRPSDHQRCVGATGAMAGLLDHAWQALSNFRGADLRTVDLDIQLDDLDGVEWTNATAAGGETRWPPRLVDGVIAHSVPGDRPGTGVFIVRYGAMAGASR